MKVNLFPNSAPKNKLTLLFRAAWFCRKSVVHKSKNEESFGPQKIFPIEIK